MIKNHQLLKSLVLLTRKVAIYIKHIALRYSLAYLPYERIVLTLKLVARDPREEQ